MNQTRKEAIRKYKELKTPQGIFAVRCSTAGRVWVGTSRNLGAEKNGFWFALRLGSHLNKALQSEWNAQGEQAFTYEILEKLDDDVHALALQDLLKTKQVEWIDRLGALKV
jgi:hypothetical protein